MTWLGDMVPGSTFDFKFTTTVNGKPTALAGSPALAVYKGNSLVQTATGATLTEEFDGVVGLQNIRMVLTNAFYDRNENYDIVFSAGTLGGVSVIGRHAGSFSIAQRQP